MIFSILVETTKWLSCNMLLYRMVEERAKMSFCKMEMILVPEFTFSAENKGSGSLPQAEQILILQVIVLKPMVVQWSWKMSWHGVEATSFDSKHPFTLFTYVLKTFKCSTGIAVCWDWDAIAELWESPANIKKSRLRKDGANLSKKPFCFSWLWFVFFLFGFNFCFSFSLQPNSQSHW